jgi:hypothetical protein
LPAQLSSGWSSELSAGIRPIIADTADVFTIVAHCLMN